MAGGRRSHGQGTFWGDLIGPNPTDRGKAGTKRSLLVDGEGGPLSIVVAGANVHDAKLLEATLDAIVVERPQPTEEEPQHLCLDKGYDNPSGRGAAAGHRFRENTEGIQYVQDAFRRVFKLRPHLGKLLMVQGLAYALYRRRMSPT